MRRVSRTPIVLLVVALVAAAIVFRNADTEAAPSAASSVAASADPSVPSSGALAASWFCAEGTSNPGGRAAETVIVSSVDDHEVTATVTVMPGGNTPSESKTYQVGAHQSVRIPVADVLATPEPGVVVEVTGGQAAVAHEVRSGDDVAAEPCARGAADSWYFAAGTTIRGTQQFLALFDPFGDDAIVDVQVVTDGGVRAPDQLQGLVVPRRSRVSVALHDLVPRQQLVAVEVHTRVGRVVADRSMLFDGTTPEDGPARRGIALSLGATVPSRTWELPFGSTADGGSTTIGVANFRAHASRAEVSILTDGGGVVTPMEVAVPARSVVAVDVGAHVPANSQFAVRAVARTDEGHNVPLVVEMLSWWPDASSSTAVASALGLPRGARRWIVPLPEASADGTITVVNPGTSAVTAELREFAADGSPPVSGPAAAIKAGGYASFELGALAAGTPRVLVVVADGDVFAGLTLRGAEGVALMSGVPDYDAPPS